jgi:hypothetical protein
VAELLRHLQVLILTAATTIHVWRDVAIMVLAGVAIAGLWLWADGMLER